MRATVAEREVAYDVVGQGPALVLLHAFPLDRRMWRATAAALGVRRTVVAPDLRGFGESPLGGDGFSIAELADDVAALLDALGLPTAAVGGLSMGGYVALAFAQRHPQRLDALVLADTKAGPDTPEARAARDEAIALVEREGVDAYLDGQLPRLLSGSASEALRAEVRAIGRQPAATVTAGLAALRDRPDRRHELPLVACPTLVVVGSDDILTPPHEARAMAQAIKGAKVAEIAGAGHLANLEAPDAFARVVSEFLG